MSFVYDAGVLIAAERADVRVWEEHRDRLERGFTPRVPAAVLAQVSRSDRQARLRLFLQGCEVVPLDEPDAHTAGKLLAKSRTEDVVDATVVVVASRHSATIITTDVDDIERLARVSRRRPRVVPL
jgi:predicted nucleic acid-binding protein